MNLSALAQNIARGAEDIRAQREAAVALIEALGTPALSALPAAQKSAFHEKLLTLPAQGDQPQVFAQEAARRVTAGQDETVRALAAEVTPALDALLAEEGLPGRRNVILFLLTIRHEYRGRLSKEEIEAAHLSAFGAFCWADLTLPYNEMFGHGPAAVNVEEVLRHFWPDAAPIEAAYDLSPEKLLFLEWLKGARAFGGADALEAYLSGRAQNAPRGEAPGDEAASRTLRLRYGAPGEGETPLAALSAKLAARRAGLPHDEAIRAQQSSPSYRAIQAVKGLALSKLPVPGRRKPRVAICVSGQLRGFKSAFPSWQREILAKVDATIFVHSWTGIGRAGAYPGRQKLPFAGAAFTETYRRIALALGPEETHARYPALFAALALGAKASAGEIEEYYGTEHVILQDDDDPAVADFSNQQKMHYKIHAADMMAREAGEFDLRMRIRPDLGLVMSAFDWNALAEAARRDALVFAEKKMAQQYGLLMMGDQFGLAAPEVMSVYADCWRDYPALGAAGLRGFPEQFEGHVSLANSCWVHGIEVMKLPARFSPLQEAEPMGPADVLAALQADDRGDKVDRQLIEAARRDL